MKKYITYISIGAIALVLSGVIYVNHTVAIKEDIPSNTVSSEYSKLEIHGSIAYRSMEDLKRLSSHIIYGEVVDETVIQVAPTDGGKPINFTNYSVIPIQNIYGKLDTAEPITVRVMGGSNEALEVIYDGAPDIKVGDRSIFFLNKSDVGGLYITKDDYYMITGDNQGVFHPDPNEEGAFVSVAEERIQLSKFASQMKMYRSSQAAEDIWRLEAIDALQGNLERGFITQEEYDQAMKALDEYATVIEE